MSDVLRYLKFSIQSISVTVIKKLIIKKTISYSNLVGNSSLFFDNNFNIWKISKDFIKSLQLLNSFEPTPGSENQSGNDNIFLKKEDFNFILSETEKLIVIDKCHHMVDGIEMSAPKVTLSFQYFLSFSLSHHIKLRN